MRRSLLDAAARRIVAQGEEGFSIQELATEAECSVGTVYRHFASKEDLVDAVRVEELASLREHLHRELDGSTGPPEPLTRAIRWARAVLAAGPSHRRAIEQCHRSLFGALPGSAGRPVARPGQEAEAILDDLVATLAEAVSIGLLRAGAARGVAVSLASMAAAISLASGAGRLDSGDAEGFLHAMAAACLDVGGATVDSVAAARGLPRSGPG